MVQRLLCSVVHDVLKRFGRSHVRHECEADVIFDYLADELEKCAYRWFGERRLTGSA